MKQDAALRDRLIRDSHRTGREHIAITGKEGRTSVVERRVNLTAPYAYIFGENVDRVLQDHKLGATTFRVLFRILALVIGGTWWRSARPGWPGTWG